MDQVFEAEIHYCGLYFDAIILEVNLVARSFFQACTRGIPGLIHKGNNVWPVHMSLRMSGISRPSLTGQKSVRKQ
jgi:hypothetical protein